MDLISLKKGDFKMKEENIKELLIKIENSLIPEEDLPKVSESYYRNNNSQGEYIGLTLQG